MTPLLPYIRIFPRDHAGFEVPGRADHGAFISNRLSEGHLVVQPGVDHRLDD